MKPTPSNRLTSPRLSLLDIIGAALLAGALFGLLYWTSERLGYNWQWYRLSRYFAVPEEAGLVLGPLLLGLGMTIKLAVQGLALTMVIGLGAALMRLSTSPVARALAYGYVELIRNTPLLIQILFIYFVISPTIGLGRFAAGVLALALFEGAYAAEIIRSGIVSLPQGQWEAAYSLGLTKAASYRRVILPQAVRRVLPPLTGQAVSLVKDSSLISVISVFELTMQGKLIVADTFLTFEVWFTVAAMYLVLNLSLSLFSQALERRLA